ncbi:DUF3961 domain-containing protein [Bacillus cereus]
MLQKILLTYFRIFQKINRYFGIEENVSDQIWFYGFFATSIFYDAFHLLIFGYPIWILEGRHMEERLFLKSSL